MSEAERLKAYQDCFTDALALAIACEGHDTDTAQELLNSLTDKEAKCALNALSQITGMLARQISDDHPDREPILRVLGHVNSTNPPDTL